MAQQTFEFERDIQGKNEHSVYTHCLNCHSWGINGPFETECGNCGSNETLTYYDSKTINNYLTKTNNMAQQTAVEWLAKALENYGDPQVCEINWKDLDSLVEQAKQMEKKQHQFTWVYEGDIDNASFERFERYYQVTFGGQGSPDTSPNTQNK